MGLLRGRGWRGPRSKERGRWRTRTRTGRCRGRGACRWGMAGRMDVVPAHPASTNLSEWCAFMSSH